MQLHDFVCVIHIPHGNCHMSHAEQEMLTLSEYLISPLVSIEVHVVLSFVFPYFML